MQEFSIDNASAGAAVQVFSANGIYDPDITGIGHQPMGFDELCDNYNHFTVVGSKIVLRPTIDAAANVTPGYWGVALCDTENAITGMTATALFENERVTRPRTWGNLNNMLNMNAKASMNFSLKKFFNIRTLDSDRFQSTASANPSEQAYFVCYVAEVNDNDPGSIKFIATIDYIVICHEPKNGDQSLRHASHLTKPEAAAPADVTDVDKATERLKALKLAKTPPYSATSKSGGK